MVINCKPYATAKSLMKISDGVSMDQKDQNREKRQTPGHRQATPALSQKFGGRSRASEICYKGMVFPLFQIESILYIFVLFNTLSYKASSIECLFHSFEFVRDATLIDNDPASMALKKDTGHSIDTCRCAYALCACHIFRFPRLNLLQCATDR